MIHAAGISLNTERKTDMNKEAIYKLSYGVYVIGTLDGERPTGCTANSAMQITSSPATIAVSINKNNYTNSCIKASGRFSISVLPEDVDPSVIGTFGFASGRDKDKFAETGLRMLDSLPVVWQAAAGISLKVIDSMETETHTVFLGEVTDADVYSDGTPMTYAYYHNVVKGKSPKNAPTYRAEEEKKDVWTCGVCGYVYDGATPFEELPESYTCPVCGQPKSVFKKG